MKTYIFVEKNGNASVIISAENEDEAWAYLQKLVIDWHSFRSPEVEEE